MKSWQIAFLLLCVIALALSGCAPVECSNCVRVLFIGNSYTYVNDLPNTFAQLADAGGHKIQTGMLANGGWTLSEHAQSPDVLNTLQTSQWNYVVIQEQSEIPAFEASRNITMYPSARVLVDNVRKAGADPIFFQTWAHRDGMPTDGLVNFEGMQYEIDMGYAGIASELNVPIAPVGDAWFNALLQYPGLQLWQDDGSHPTEQGTYLAACVFYAVIFKESPVGLSYVGNIPADIAAQLQGIAAQVALP